MWRRNWSLPGLQERRSPTIRWSHRSAAPAGPETGRQAYGIDAVNEFDPIFELVTNTARRWSSTSTRWSHESGAAQIEINFNHGDPVRAGGPSAVLQADGSARSRRCATTGLRHFMASRCSTSPAVPCILHTSRSIDAERPAGTCSPTRTAKGFREMFHAFIAGLQKITWPAGRCQLDSRRNVQHATAGWDPKSDERRSNAFPLGATTTPPPSASGVAGQRRPGAAGREPRRRRRRQPLPDDRRLARLRLSWDHPGPVAVPAGGSARPKRLAFTRSRHLWDALLQVLGVQAPARGAGRQSSSTPCGTSS